MRLPEIVGVEMVGVRQEGITATDIVLELTEFLREERVVSAYLEFFGSGAESLSIGDGATISNMTPEFRATAGLFYIDQQTIDYLRLTGRDSDHVKLVEAYAKANRLVGFGHAPSGIQTKLGLICLRLEETLPDHRIRMLGWQQINSKITE